MASLNRKRLSVLLLVMTALIVLPALLYTAYELSRLSDTEKEIAAVYERQLDAVLFSVNQYAWDVSSGWVNMLLNDLVAESNLGASASTESSERSGTAHALTDTRGERLPEALRIQPALLFAAVMDTQYTIRRVLRGSDTARTGGEPPSRILAQIRDSLDARGTTLARLSRLRLSGYRKLEPVLLPATSGPADLCLIAAADDGAGRTAFVLLFIDSEDFIRSMLAPKFQEFAGTEFSLACSEKSSGRIITSTEANASATALHQRSNLWLFPDYTIGIRLRGETVEALARQRFTRDVLFFAAVDLLLLVGVWFVYRNLKRELRLAEMKTDFVSNVSHELRTPLALIRMYAESLEMRRVPDPAQQHAYHGIIVQETERLSRLINNILAFSRIESGNKQYHKAPRDLNAIVTEVMRMYRPHLEANDFGIAVAMADRLPLIDADGEAAAEALINLLDNAMKYSGDTKEVVVRTGTDATWAWVEVQDHGIGIPASLHRKVFEKFYRVSEGLVHTAKGSGLGLALVDHIMRAHGGRVDLHSIPGEGSSFRLMFPVHPQRVRQ
jgi:two-component system phosphate regulon sensor histidine kinase PhoR